MYTNPLELLSPLEVSTLTCTTPGDVVEGMVTAIEVAELTVTAAPVNSCEPNETVAPEEKLSPLMYAVPPPLTGDESGVIEVIAGIVDALLKMMY